MAYLTRLQMYRAMMESSTTNANLVFKPHNEGDNARFPDQDEAAAIDDLPNPAAALAFSQRHIGATNINAGLNSKVANIGNPDLPQRAAWKDLLDVSNTILMNLIGSSRDDFGSHPNPARLDPLSTDFDHSTGGLEAPAKDMLESFRAFYAPSNLIQNKREEYYAIAFASTVAKSRILAPHATFTNLGNNFNYLQRAESSPHRPFRFTFHKGSSANDHQYGAGTRYCAARIVIRIFAVHNALYGSDLKPLGNVAGNFDEIKVNRIKFAAMLENINAGIAILTEDIVAWIIGYDARMATSREAVEELIAEELTDLDFSVHKLTDSEIASISLNPQYNEYFTTTFNQDIITTVPIIHNLYLTEQYFEEISTVLLSPKIRTIDTLIEIILEDKDFSMKPNMDRPASRQAINAANGDFDFGPFLRDLIVKILIETPINILKGICELIDPHIAITKMIKTGSMIAFSQGARILDTGAAEPINELIKEEFPDLGIKVTGEGLMGLIVCMMEAGFTAGDMGLKAAINESQGLPADAEPPLPINFFPTATLKGGIDFTGTVSGMVMAPPLPLGLLYLLLELIKNALNQTENLDTPPRETVCEDDEGGENT